MTPSEAAGPLVFLVAGEPSGDQLGAKLMRALRAESGGAVRFAGVGGEAMEAEGLRPLFPVADLAVMGILEVVPSIPKVYCRVRQTVAAVKAMRPDLLVTIDSPSFTLEISQRLKGQGIPLVHYVAPSVWAWKAWRAKQVAGYLDHLLTLLPFEPPYFEKHGLATSFVGHPALEDIPPEGAGPAFRQRHGIPPDAPLLAVLPGSRRGEVSRLSGVLAESLDLLRALFPGLQVVVPTVGTVAALVRAQVAAWPVPVKVLEGREEKIQAFAAADTAIAASGTVAVELAAAGLPAVIVYRTHPVTAALALRLLRVRYVSLPNLLLDREAQPELLQYNCTAPKIVEATAHLLSKPAARAAQCDAYREVIAKLTPADGVPSRQAALKLLEIVAG